MEDENESTQPQGNAPNADLGPLVPIVGGQISQGVV